MLVSARRNRSIESAPSFSSRRSIVPCPAWTRCVRAAKRQYCCHDGFPGVRLAVVRGVRQPGRRALVDHDGGVRMPLEDRRRAPRRERSLDGGGDRRRLRRAARDQHQVAGVDDRRQPLRHDVARDVVGMVEEAGVVGTCRGGQRLDARPRPQRRAGLVEADVTVGADAEQLHVDTAELGEQRLVPRTGVGQIVGVHIGAVDVVSREVDVVDEVLVARNVGSAADDRRRDRRTRRAAPRGRRRS